MYPISLNLQGKKCIVFGAGKVAQRRVWGLLDAGAEVTVAAPEKMPACWETARLTYLEQAYAPELLEEQFLVFAATDDSAENARIVRDAQAAGKLVSSATVSPDSTPDFAVPAHRRHGDVTISVATEGDAPALAGAICRELEPKLASYSEICTCLGILRRTWKETIPDDFHRMQLLRMLTEPKALELFQQCQAIYEEKLSPMDEHYAGLYNNMSAAYSDLGQLDQAAACLMHAAVIMDGLPAHAVESAVTHANLAALYAKQQNWANAKAHIASACSFLKDQPQAADKLAQFQAMQEMFSKYAG